MSRGGDWGSALARKLEAEGKIPARSTKRKPRGTLRERISATDAAARIIAGFGVADDENPFGPELPANVLCEYTLYGAPRTKKNSLRRVYAKGRTLSLSSKAFETYEKNCLEQLREEQIASPIDFPVNLRAVVYRKQASGDLIGYLQGVCDILQKAGVLVDDKWIVSFDGCRLSKDAMNPRVELVLERIAP